MKSIWIEDDCTVHDPLHEDLQMAYRRLFMREWDKEEKQAAYAIKDQGDGMAYHMPFGVVLWESFPGNSAIFKE